MIVFLRAEAALPVAAGETVWLEDLDVARVTQDWGTPRRGMSVEGHPLRIAGEIFAHGLGTHANSIFVIQLDGGTKRFSAKVGVDDEVGRSPASVRFEIHGDGKILWKSPIMKAGKKAEPVSLDVGGLMKMILLVTDGGDGIDFDHADWVNAKFEVTSAPPRALARPRAPRTILTPPAPETPRINGPSIVGAKPGRPFLYTIPATGKSPMHFAAQQLPDTLAVDAPTGIITGAVAEPGTYRVTLEVENELGIARRELRIVIGDTIALTPPLGWNSWNCWGCSIDDTKVRAAADAMVSSGLIQHGFTYINIDDCWQGDRDPKTGEILPNAKFPDIKALCEYIHSKGLKLGIYTDCGPKTCAGYEGSKGHEEQDIMTYARWGVDYVKIDWCNTRGMEPVPSYAVFGEAMKKCPRDIVFSICNWGVKKPWEWGTRVGGNLWRTTGDIRDSWGSMAGIGFRQADLADYASSGHWNDPDMLVVGKVGWGPKLHESHLTPDEQYTHISLWCLLSAPLLIGCDMADMDAFTMNLLTNDEVLALDQDALGRQAVRVAKQGPQEVWLKELEGGARAVGLFNRGLFESKVTATWKDLRIEGTWKVRDLWRQKDLGTAQGEYGATVPGHGVVLFKLTPQ